MAAAPKVMSFGAPLTYKVPGGLAEARRRWGGSGPSGETHHRTPNGSCGGWHSRSPSGGEHSVNGRFDRVRSLGL